MVEDELVTSVTEQIANNNLIGSYVIAYYKAPDGLVYALAVMPYNIVKWSVNNKVDSRIKPPAELMKGDAALWQQFKAQKAYDELAEEIGNMNNEE